MGDRLIQVEARRLRVVISEGDSRIPGHGSHFPVTDDSYRDELDGYR